MTERTLKRSAIPGTTSGVPKVKASQSKAPDTSRVGGRIMAACCLVMIAVAGLVISQLGSEAGWADRILTLAPLVFCIGAHFVMHRFMGLDCHGSSSSKKKDRCDD